jgi:ATP-dependent Lhr-like helicase
MQTVYLSEETPPWVDNPVADFLREGRETFRSSKLDKSFFVSEERDLHVFLWQGSQTNAVFGAAFGMAGIPAEVHDFGITLPKTTKQQAMAAIRKLSAQGSVSAGEVAAFVENIRVGKFAYLVPEELLRAQWARDNSTIVERVPNLAAGLLGAK